MDKSSFIKYVNCPPWRCGRWWCPRSSPCTSGPTAHRLGGHFLSFVPVYVKDPDLGWELDIYGPDPESNRLQKIMKNLNHFRCKKLIYFSMTQMCGMQRRQLLKSFKPEPKVKNVIGSFKGRILIWTKINRIRSILSHFVMLLLFLSFIYLNLSCLFLFLPYLSEMTIFSHSN